MSTTTGHRANSRGRKKGGKGGASDPATEAFAAGLAMARRNPAFAAVEASVCRQPDCVLTPVGGLAAVTSNGTVHVHPTKRADPAEWAWVLAHCLLHLGFGHVPAAAHGPREQPDRFDLAARCVVVNRFLLTHPTGRPPVDLPDSYPGGDEEQLAARWRRDGIPALYEDCGTAGGQPDQVLTTWRTWNNSAVPDWETSFARALTRSVSAAMDVAGGRRDSVSGVRAPQPPWDRALNWFVSSYPLLGGLAAGLTVVADAELARSQSISIAAVSSVAGEIYINPLRALSDEEWRFVLAHEMLHAALRHGERRGGRDPFLFNVAADYVVNDWLVQMRVGDMPEGLLYDPGLRGLSAEEVYDRIAVDLRRQRRLATLRGRGAGDILGEPLPHADARAYTDLDEFYRRGLVQGFDLHRYGERGLLPSGLVEEIRALAHPPVPWDAGLARWFDEYVPRPEPVRSYARPARRQASTPGIPRAGRYFPPQETARCTFGVVLDTSGSMDNGLLGKALGAIASYAQARDVPAARVVFCDAAAYDAGYLPPAEIAGRVRVRGRGGTELQPGIDLLQRADDFPPTAPVLVITDGWCDTLRIRREHAFLIPQGASLPFTPRGPVFRLS
ncbi:vWA domain-containing protein [Streptomyces sp. NBC_01358]|uniref:vWA domain-containing protein n=1 Tax=Streptomyces sp. NBC_01358 TaxID=2903837 RepID=UPI002E347E17|nr:VWA-like domain-containing protein [Streptomyces sp. NBC_01358]